MSFLLQTQCLICHSFFKVEGLGSARVDGEGFGDGEVQRRTAANSGDGLGCGEGTRGGLRRLQSLADGDSRPYGLVAASIAAMADFGERERELTVSEIR
ncbi:hypothetical protein Scep_014576 [Stephania cephalantha]|uniref:Uncharacterized protein n=1 Tax=Stephania cephalantha TaxID=152367 RepID=A0AAP0J2V7_9MAGN